MQHQKFATNNNSFVRGQSNYHYARPLPSFKEFVDTTFSEHDEQLSNNYKEVGVVSPLNENHVPVTYSTNSTKCNSDTAHMHSIYESEIPLHVDAWGIDVSPTIYQPLLSFPLTSSLNTFQRSMGDNRVDVARKITSLEFKLNIQEQELSRLMYENESLKKKRKLELSSVKSNKKKSPPSNNNAPKPFNLIMENDLCERYQGIIVGKIEEYKVTWESVDYIILNAFSNRDEIFNYYCPLFESKFPDTIYRIVLEKDDYKKLFRENPHLTKFFKSHAWRISIFSFEFYEFIKKCKKLL